MHKICVIGFYTKLHADRGVVHHPRCAVYRLDRQPSYDVYRAVTLGHGQFPMTFVRCVVLSNLRITASCSRQPGGFVRHTADPLAAVCDVTIPENCENCGRKKSQYTGRGRYVHFGMHSKMTTGTPARETPRKKADWAVCRRPPTVSGGARPSPRREFPPHFTQTQAIGSCHPQLSTATGPPATHAEEQTHGKRELSVKTKWDKAATNGRERSH